MTRALEQSPAPALGAQPVPAQVVPGPPRSFPPGRSQVVPEGRSHATQVVPGEPGQVVPDPDQDPPAEAPLVGGPWPLPRPPAGGTPLAEQLRILLRFWAARADARLQPWREDPVGAFLSLPQDRPESLAEHHSYSVRCEWIPEELPGLIPLRVIGILFHMLIAAPVMFITGSIYRWAARPLRPARIFNAALSIAIIRGIAALIGLM